MNPLDNYPAVRKALYLVQWLVNGIIVVAGAYYVLADVSPDKWYIIAAGLGPVLWTYLGITAQQNTPVPDKPKDQRGVFEANTVWVVLGIVGIVLIVLLIAGQLKA